MSSTRLGHPFPAQVLHKRITSALTNRLGPHLTSYADLVPAGLPGTARDRLNTLAAAADDRRRELGERVAADPPQWAPRGPRPAARRCGCTD